MSNHQQYSLTCFYSKTLVQSKLNPLQLYSPTQRTKLSNRYWNLSLSHSGLPLFNWVSLCHEEPDSYHFDLIVKKRVWGLHWYAILCKNVFNQLRNSSLKKVSKLLLRSLVLAIQFVWQQNRCIDIVHCQHNNTMHSCRCKIPEKIP